MTRRLAAVFAHPDDDTYGLAGTLAMGKGDVEYAVIVATSGEAGPISDPSLATRESLAEVRENEEREALLAAGAETSSVHFLRYPDGELKEIPREELVHRVADLLREARPQVVVTFGPEGITMHDDHITIGAAATEAFHRARGESETGQRAPRDAFQRLLYVAIPRSAIDRFWESLRARGEEVGDPEGPFMPRGVPDRTITHRVDCTGVLKSKIEALHAHRTQRDEVDQIPEDLQEAVLGYECFVQAFPPVTEPPSRSAGSVFEGVEA
ncbi:MAG TPA: PIG-L family deacetylase [Actinomycetota bacterium]|nr:PIG-L family deacetylase [Actinomycetota bacterium]